MDSKTSDSKIPEKYRKKFDDLLDWFELKSVSEIKGKADTVSLNFQCKKCLPAIKYVKCQSRAPTSNLKTHIHHSHPAIESQFLKLKAKNVTSETPTTPKRKPEEENSMNKS